MKERCAIKPQNDFSITKKMDDIFYRYSCDGLRLGHTEYDLSRQAAISDCSRWAIYLYYTVLHYPGHTKGDLVSVTLPGDIVIENYKVVVRSVW